MSKDVNDAIANRRAELRRLQQNRGSGIRPAGMSALGGGLRRRIGKQCGGIVFSRGQTEKGDWKWECYSGSTEWG